MGGIGRDRSFFSVDPSWLKLSSLQYKVRPHYISVDPSIIMSSVSCSDFNVDSVSFQLQKAKFPSHKWKSLASGLRVASLVPNIEANCRDTVGMLQELISRWVGSTTGNQWVMLIDAVVMCDEPAVAKELATAVGCPLRLSGTTTNIDSSEIKLDVPAFCVGCNGTEHPGSFVVQ